MGERDDKPNRIEAEGLLAGILLDTQDFTLHTGVRTFEAAAALRRYGAETERVRRLFDVTMVEYNAKADLVEKAQMSKTVPSPLAARSPRKPGSPLRRPPTTYCAFRAWTPALWQCRWATGSTSLPAAWVP